MNGFVHVLELKNDVYPPTMNQLPTLQPKRQSELWKQQELIHKILKYQIMLADKQDDRCYSIEDAQTAVKD